MKRQDRNLGGLRLDYALSSLAGVDNRRSKILEVGCGVGRFTKPISTDLLHAQLIAFDLSHAAVSRACSDKGRAEYSVADVMSLPFADASIDAVVFFDVLEHLTDPGAALAEMARVTRQQGLLHGYVPCEGEPATLHYLLRRWTHSLTQRHAGHVQHFRQRGVLSLVGEAGYVVTDLRFSSHLLGQTLDVMTFTAREIVHRRRATPEGAPAAFYDRSALGGGVLGRVYGVLRVPLDVAAHTESRLLRQCPWALGLHITARRISEA